MPAPNVTSVQGANLLKKSGSEAVLNVFKTKIRGGSIVKMNFFVVK